MRHKFPIAAEFDGGYFAANMYGNVMQFDHVSGKDYIEFVVRCHWGTMPSNLQAWMVAHRFSKFDELNKNVSYILCCRCPNTFTPLHVSHRAFKFYVAFVLACA